MRVKVGHTILDSHKNLNEIIVLYNNCKVCNIRTKDMDYTPIKIDTSILKRLIVKLNDYDKYEQNIILAYLNLYEPLNEQTVDNICESAFDSFCGKFVNSIDAGSYVLATAANMDNLQGLSAGEMGQAAADNELDDISGYYFYK